MNYATIVKNTATKSGHSQKDVREVLKAFIATVQEGVQGMKDGDIFRVQGLVSYKKRAIPERKHRNPATGGEIVKPAHSVVKTSAPKAIKDLA